MTVSLAELVPPAPANARNISNSEVTAWLTCKQSYWWAFGMNLAPKVTSKPLSRGTLGHLACQYYIEARLEGHSHTESLTLADRAFSEAFGQVSMDIILETQFLFKRYMEFHDGFPDWEFLGTEQRYDLKVTDDITIPMRYDLMCREISTGKILVGDFKFTYDFWSPEDHQLNGQMPKYIVILNAAGVEVDGGFLEEIRTRPLGKEKSSDYRNLWRRTKYFPTPAKKRNMIKQHVAASLEIVEFRQMTDEDREARIIPVLNKHGACKYCNFKDLCASKLDGKDIAYDIQTGYVHNTYGYNENAELMLEDTL